jgi:hypothetical protein
MSALNGLRDREIDKLELLIGDGGLLLVHGPDAQEATEVAAAAVLRVGGVNGEADLDGCVDDRDVARVIARAVTRAMLGDDRLLDLPDDRRSPAQQRAWLDASRAFGSLKDLPDLMNGGWPAGHEPARLIADVITALGRAGQARQVLPTLALYAIDALIKVPRSRFTDPDGLLWAMRSAAQGAPRVTLLLVGGPAGIDLIEDPDAAFYGWGRPVQLTRLDDETLSDAIREDLALDPGVALRVAEFCDGLPRIARLLSNRLRLELAKPTSADPVGASWSQLLTEQAGSLRVTTRLLSDLHRVALPVCQALATGRAPYAAAHSGEVTRALKLLRVHGICESPKPRTWRLTDPLLAAWLRGKGTRMSHARRAALAP